MNPDETGEEFVAVEVELPRQVLGDIDRLAVFHGYETPSAVVREALESHS
jgi:Arc/MetJ-type ribon-helix-helix transcriptional regulator